MIKKFAICLTKRGFPLKDIKLIITEAALHFEKKMPFCKQFISPKSATNMSTQNLYFHAQFHPKGVKRSLIHRCFTKSLNKLDLYD